MTMTMATMKASNGDPPTKPGAKVSEVVAASILLLKDILKDFVGVTRPSLAAVYAMFYLYNNENPSFWWFLYFGTVYSAAGCAGNDYMDWDHDRADKNRKAELSRGMASSKERVWWIYTITSVATYAYGIAYDPGFGFMYFVMEFIGQWFYNGIFLGVAMNTPSLTKQIGFPMDILVNTAAFCFPAQVQMRSWVPPFDIWCISVAITCYAQLKDYEFEKGTNVQTTATVLGPVVTRTIMLLTAPIMLYYNPGFLPLCIYMPFKLAFPKPLKKLKFTVMVFANFLAVLVLQLLGKSFARDKDSTFMSETIGEKYPSSTNLFVVAAPNTSVQLLTFYLVALLLSFTLRAFIAARFFAKRYYYAFLGVYNRHLPYNREEMWNSEEDPYVLLLKVLPLTGRSATALMMFFPEESMPGALCGYMIFRVLDTWADVCKGREQRIAGLKILPKRLRLLQEGKRPDIDTYADSAEVVWNIPLKNSKKHQVAVDFVKNVHLFDEFFLARSEEEKNVLVNYAEELCEGMIELEERSSQEPPSVELTRRTSEIGNQLGVIWLLRGLGLADMAEDMETKPPSKEAESFQDFWDFTYYANLASGIEGDVKERVFHDKELITEDGYVSPEVFQRVQLRWVKLALDLGSNSSSFLLDPRLGRSMSMRILSLGFMNYTVEYFEKFTQLQLGRPYKKPSTWKVLILTLASSTSWQWYEKAVHSSLDRVEAARGSLKEKSI